METESWWITGCLMAWMPCTWATSISGTVASIEYLNAPQQSMGLRFKPRRVHPTLVLKLYHGGMYCGYPVGHLQLMTRAVGPL